MIVLMKHLSVILSALLFFGSRSFATVTAPTCSTTYRTAVNESEPLYYRDDQHNKYVGISSDVIDELAKRTGCNFEAQQINRSKLYQEMSSFRVDLALVTIRNNRYDKVGKFLPITSIQREVAGPKELVHVHSSIQDFINNIRVKFIILPGAPFFFTPEESARLEKEGRFMTTTSLQEAYALLVRSKNTVIMQTTFVQDYFFAKMKLDRNFARIPDRKTTFEIGAYYIVKKSNEQNLPVIEKTLKQIASDGTWDRIIRKHTKLAENSELLGKN
ncbi:hypothetical protein DOE51_16825 [Bdellovibrio sp. NC01]|nr:hypothetical protein DOE51_16825 [Bdellovibrio sp. NC01]